MQRKRADHINVLNVLRNLFRRPPIRMGSVDNRSMRTTTIRNAGFVSFFNGQGCVSPRHPDLQDRRLKRQRRFRVMAFVSMAALSAWFVIESAQALAAF